VLLTSFFFVQNFPLSTRAFHSPGGLAVGSFPVVGLVGGWAVGWWGGAGLVGGAVPTKSTQQ